MARQKSENPIVPQGPRKLSVTSPLARGGKGVPVDQEMEQPGLPFATAETPRGTRRRRRPETSDPRRHRAPKASVQTGKTPSTTLESVVWHLDEALDHVARNKGAPGSDGLRIAEVQENWPALRRKLARALRSGAYCPGPTRQKSISKPGGGERKLSIPNVVDRVVQEAMRRVIQPLFEPDFHPSSHGYRPERSCHSAIAEAREHVLVGREWMVDLDLSKFFDRVNHQRLLAKVSRKVEDRPLMRTLARILRSPQVLPEGVIIQTEEGVPQGGPLSPLLSNIVLDELDWELDRRGHRFTRYADDIAIFVRSERSGRRVMESVTRYIEGRMRLKVNEEKSAVRRPDNGNYLGFRLVIEPDGSVETRLSGRTMKRALARIRELTPRNWGGSIERCIARLNTYWDGWFGFFGICSASALRELQTLDGRARRRLRAIQLKQWKRKRTIVRKLNRMKFSKKVGRNIYRGRRGWWSLSHDGVVSHRLNGRWMAEQGFVSLRERYAERELSKVAPAQLQFEWG